MALILSAFCLLTSLTIKAQDPEGERLFPIIQDNKIGYIDKTGKVIISPRFDKGFLNEGNLKDVEFSEGLAIANVKGKWGYIDSTGELVIKPIYVVRDSTLTGRLERAVQPRSRRNHE